MAAHEAPPSLGRKRPRKQKCDRNRIAATHNLGCAPADCKTHFAVQQMFFMPTASVNGSFMIGKLWFANAMADSAQPASVHIRHADFGLGAVSHA
ncbi:MAG TPA: hypothetical protein VMU82_07495 [Acetobacteraceae bacterium]|nr:hypothetical protein [Acetobacteraceae bacterium]